MSNLGWCSSEPDSSAEAHEKAIEINPLNKPSDGDPAPQESGSEEGVRTVRQPLTGVQDKFWPVGSVLKVAFTNGSDEQQQRIMDIAAMWSDHANIQFDAGEHNDPDIRIALSDGRNWSKVGTDSRLETEAGNVSMRFSSFTPGQGTILHEFGHALGLKHEHQNPDAGIDWDKEEVYDSLGGPPNNWSRSRVDGNVFNKLTDDSLNYSAFDPDSVMGYNIPASWTNDGFSTSPGSDPSPTDISYIGDWYPFGGFQRPSRRPASDDVRVYARGISRRVFEKRWNGERWDPGQDDWELVRQGDISGHPGVTDFSKRSDDTTLVVRGVSGSPYVIRRERGGWSDWKDLGGKITGNPTVIRTSDGTVWAFVRGTSGRPFYKRRPDGQSWDTSPGGWTSLGGGITGLIGASDSGDSVGLAVRGTSGRVFVKWWDGSAWHPGTTQWMNLSGAVTAQPAIAWHHGKLHVVIRTPGGAPEHRIVEVEREQAVSGWQGLDGGIIGSPTLVHGQDNQLHLYVRGTSRRIFRKRWDGDGWTPENRWENLGGQAIDSPVAIALPQTSQSGSEVHVFVAGLSRRGFRKVWREGGWVPDAGNWETLGGQLT